MTFAEILKKPIEIVVENNISEDVIKPSDTVSELINKLAKFADKSMNDLLVIYTDDVTENYPVKAVITNKEIPTLLNMLDDTKKPVKELNLESKFPLRYSVYKNEPIEKVYNIFKVGLTDIIIVLNEENQAYVGKIKRNSFVDRLKIFLS